MPLAYLNPEAEIPETLEVILSTLPNPCIGQYTYGHEYMMNSIQHLQQNCAYEYEFFQANGIVDNRFPYVEGLKIDEYQAMVEMGIIA